MMIDDPKELGIGLLSNYILVETGPLYILTCFENKTQVASTPMPQMYQNKMVRHILINVAMICTTRLIQPMKYSQFSVTIV